MEKNAAFFYKKNGKRMQERCVLLKRMDAQPCHNADPDPKHSTKLLDLFY